MGYQCSLHDGDMAASHLHTSLETGATVATCNECLPVALIGALASELSLDPQGLYDHIQRFEKRQRKAEADAAAKQEQEGYQGVGGQKPEVEP